MMEDDPDNDPDCPLPQLCSPLEFEVYLRLASWDMTWKLERILKQREVAIVLVASLNLYTLSTRYSDYWLTKWLSV
jgi:hypothetical protein